MEQDDTTRLVPGLSVPGPREAGTTALDGVEVSEQIPDEIPFGSLANPNRLRLGVARSS